MQHMSYKGVTSITNHYLNMIHACSHNVVTVGTFNVKVNNSSITLRLHFIHIHLHKITIGSRHPDFSVLQQCDVTGETGLYTNMLRLKQQGIQTSLKYVGKFSPPYGFEREK